MWPLEDIDPDCKDLINQLLNLNPEDRLGAGAAGTRNDMKALMNHKFFEGINFESNLANLRVKDILKETRMIECNDELIENEFVIIKHAPRKERKTVTLVLEGELLKKNILGIK